jgi:hypothetical protein
MTESTVEVVGRCKEGFHLVRHGSSPFIIFLDQKTGFVNGIDYLCSDGSSVVRKYRAAEISTIDGVLIAGKMTMVDTLQHHQTSIYLERAWYDRQIDPAVFDSSFRKSTREYLARL